MDPMPNFNVLIDQIQLTEPNLARTQLPRAQLQRVAHADTSENSRIVNKKNPAQYYYRAGLLF